jgi:hypothetical protein
MDKGQTAGRFGDPKGGQRHDKTGGKEESVATKRGTTFHRSSPSRGHDVGSYGLGVDTRIPVASLRLLVQTSWTRTTRTSALSAAQDGPNREQGGLRRAQTEQTPRARL